MSHTNRQMEIQTNKHLPKLKLFNFLRLKNKNVNAILSLLSVDLVTLTAPLSRGAEKFVTAAGFGELSRSVEKCEARYACPLKLEAIQKLYPFNQSL